jgi:outer membrane protein TolC
VIQLELERARLLTQLRSLRSSFAEETAALHRIAGVDAPRPNGPILAQLLDQIPPLPQAGAQPDTGLDGSPWLEASAGESERRRLEGKQAGRTAFGRPELEVTYAHAPTIGELESFESLGLRLHVPLPLGQARKRHNAQSAAEVRRAEAHERQTRRILESRWIAARTRAEQAAATLDSLKEIEEAIGDPEHSVVQQYRLGVISYLAYLDGLERLDSVRLQVIDTRQSLLRARLELAVLTGDAAVFPLPDFDEESP